MTRARANRADGAPRAIVLAGVSGSGKTTVGRRLAQRLGWAYVEADDHHPPANIAKMRRGEPLTDDDRAPWLAALRTALDHHLDAGEGVVLTSSALKAAYRRVLADGRPEVMIVLLHGSPRLLAQRLNAREGHFFDPRLLQSQLETLDLPGPSESALIVDVASDPDAIVETIVRELNLLDDPGPPSRATPSPTR